MRFSIIVPVYNSSEYLDECVTSVLSQNFEDWEMILVDDGSTDGSGDIADRYADGDSRISVIHKENEGQLYARRDGISHAKGEYIVCLDSDDYWESDTLSVINENIDRYAADFIMFPCRLTGDPAVEGTLVGTFKDTTCVVEKREVYEKIISAHLLNSMALKAFKRELAYDDNTDYRVFRTASYGEDKVQTLHLVTGAEKIVYIAKSLYNYRCNPSSVSNNPDVDLIPKRISNPMFEVLLEYMKKWSMTDVKSTNKYMAYYCHHFLTVAFTFRNICKKNGNMNLFRKVKWKQFVLKDKYINFCNPRMMLKDRIKLFLLFKMPFLLL